MPLKLNINDIIALYKDGVSVKKISERYNCSDTTIRNKLRQNGVKLKNKRITKEKSQLIRKKDVRNFFQYIYYDARQFKLKRKYNIFLEHM